MILILKLLWKWYFPYHLPYGIIIFPLSTHFPFFFFYSFMLAIPHPLIFSFFFLFFMLVTPHLLMIFFLSPISSIQSLLICFFCNSIDLNIKICFSNTSSLWDIVIILVFIPIIRLYRLIYGFIVNNIDIKIIDKARFVSLDRIFWKMYYTITFKIYLFWMLVLLSIARYF